MPGPTAEALRQRGLVNVNEETVTNVESNEFPGHYPDEDHAWDLDNFRDNLHVYFHRNEPNDAVFSLVGIDPSIANAFRRIILSELPSLAIETCFITNNTSIIQDEVLAHRIGLIPLKGSKEGLRWMKWREQAHEDDLDPPPSYDHDTVILKLNVECTWKDDGHQKLQQGITEPTELYNHAHVYASDLTFHPPESSQQAEIFTRESGIVKATHPGILIAKLRPGHKIIMECRAQLGIGADHAKFSPVATASYRLLPVIDIKRPILGDDAVKFQACFPKGVIDIEAVTSEEADKKGSGYEGKQGEQKAVVKHAIRDTVTRECLRHEEFKDKVKLGRKRDHFIFSIESTGQFDSDELFIDSIKLLKRKCLRIQRDFAQVREQG